MRVLLALLSATLTCASVAAQDNLLPGQKLTQPPVIDGRIDPEEWKDATPFAGLVDENTGAPMAEQGRFWIAYDSRFIYFAAFLEDREPRRIEANEYRTNVGLGGDDYIQLRIDPFGTLNDFNSFAVNPRGATMINISGGRAAKREWLGEIQAAGRVVEGGWSAEMRIPWEIMRLPAPGVRELRVNLERNHKRVQRQSHWRYTGSGNNEAAGRWQDVQVPPTPPPSWRLLPFGYLGWDEREKGVFNMGLDFRRALSPDLDLVGTINPDFRNIENQILSLDFSYVERLTGESRPFFREGEGFFWTSMDAPLFTSQRIREFDMGVKSFGKLDDRTDIGALATFDFGHQAATVAKVRRWVTNDLELEAAYAGWDSRDVKNDAGFLAFGRRAGPAFFYGSTSRTRDSIEGVGFRNNLGVWYGENNLSMGIDLSEISPDFLPRIGFAPRRGFRGGSGSIERTWQVASGPLLETEIGAWGGVFEKFGGGLYRRNFGVNGSLTWRNGLDLDTSANFEEFRGFRDSRFGFSLEWPRGNPYRNWEIGYSVGRVRDRRYARSEIGFATRPIQPLQVAFLVQHLDHFERDTQSILSANYDLGRDQSINGRLVREGKDTNAYFAFRRSGNRGTEFFLIVGDPNARTWRNSVTLKVVVPFEIRG